MAGMNEEGRAEVHTHLGLGPQHDHEPPDGLEELSEVHSGREGGRARAFAGEARRRAAGAIDRVENAIDDRSGVIGMVREHPLVAVGIAFGIGLLVAGKGDTSGRFGKAKQQLRGAMIGAISAAIAQETRSLAGLFEDGEEDDDPRRSARGRARRPRRG